MPHFFGNEVKAVVF